MGRDLLIANLDKRQYISEDSYGCSAKCSSYMHGLTAHAVALLVCKPTDVQNHPYGDMAGSWCSDHVIAAGDDAPPYQGSLATVAVENQNQNLYAIAREEFDDISYDAMLMMAAGDSWYAERFAQLAKDFNIQMFFILARFAIEQELEILQLALESVNGADWKAKYRRACDKYGVEMTKDPRG